MSRKPNPLPDMVVLHATFEDCGNTVRRRSTGHLAAAKNNAGYLVTSIGDKSYLVHRVLYKMRHGMCPDIVDHVDRNKLNNADENLRPASRAENGANAVLSSANTSGVKGVTWCHGKWAVQLVVNGKPVYGGRYTCFQSAVVRSSELRQQYHGEFAGEV